MTDETLITPYDTREFVWEQRWRCNTVDEIALPDRIREKLMGYINQERIPCILLNSRSPGTGKTTTAYALARQVRCTRPLYVNASLQTDIANIRTNVHKYATGATLNGHTKVVILDEAERLSTGAQESLKGLIEQVSKTCVFILTTNNKSRLVEPLRSRCRVVDYEWSEEESVEMIKQMTIRTINILKAEGYEYDKRVVFSLVQRNFPDNRTILGTLQDYCQTYGKIDEGVLSHNLKSSLSTIVRIIMDKDFKALKQWCADNADVVGDGFLGDLTRYLIEPRKVNDTKTATIMQEGSIVDLIEFLGEEQKYVVESPDRWLFYVRVLTILGVSGGFKFNDCFKN